MTLPFTKTRSRWRTPLLATAALVVLTGGMFGVCEHMSTLRPEGNPDFIELTIERGASLEGVLDQLESKGLVRNRLVAQYILRTEEVFGALKAGRYKLRGNLNLVEVSSALKAGPNVHPIRRFTIRPGESLYEVARTIEGLGLATENEFLSAAQDFPRAQALSRHFLGEPRSKRPDGDAWLYLEGLLAADTYFLDSESKLAELIETASNRFHALWNELRNKTTSSMLDRHAALALGDYELLILASMVEEETRIPTEAARIAGVFFNRLERNMRLKSDPTAMYHSKKVGRPPTPADIRDKANPYNTYTLSGLPPGPICAPGPGALEAVFAPEQHDYIFFVAARDGSGAHVFATTGSEHMRNVNKHLRKK